jgi:hypothetical protein
MINWSTSRINFGGFPTLRRTPFTMESLDSEAYVVPPCCVAGKLWWAGRGPATAHVFYLSSWVSHVFPPYPCHSMSTCSFFGQLQILMEYLWLRLCQHNEKWTGIVICLSWERGPSWPNLDSLPTWKFVSQNVPIPMAFFSIVTTH